MDSMVEFAAEALEAGDPLIVISSEALHSELQNRLRVEGLDWNHATYRGGAAFHDVQGLLAEILEHGSPTPERFRHTIGRVLAPWERLPRRRRVRVYGGLMDELWMAGRMEAVERLERWWHEISLEKGLSVLCGYRLGSMHREVNTAALGRMNGKG